ncbi:MAG: hypothetical protein JO043_10430 [Candidatus Eremiobacteraeota bacterium]|nr:hypothetical protein [Candidatus Eremiobacteraeota bacterium]
MRPLFVTIVASALLAVLTGCLPGMDSGSGSVSTRAPASIGGGGAIFIPTTGVFGGGHPLRHTGDTLGGGPSP